MTIQFLVDWWKNITPMKVRFLDSIRYMLLLSPCTTNKEKKVNSASSERFISRRLLCPRYKCEKRYPLVLQYVYWYADTSFIISDEWFFPKSKILPVLNIFDSADDRFLKFAWIANSMLICTVSYWPSWGTHIPAASRSAERFSCPHYRTIHVFRFCWSIWLHFSRNIRK